MELAPGLRCLCLWKKSAKIVDMISQSLEQNYPPVKRTKQKGNKGKTVDTFVALWSLQFILANDPHAVRKELFTKHRKKMDIILAKMQNMIDHPFAFETLVKLAIHKAVFDGEYGAMLIEEEKTESENISKNNNLMDEEESGEKTSKRIVCHNTPKVITDIMSCVSDMLAAGSTKKRKNVKGTECTEDLVGVLLLALSECNLLGMGKPTHECIAEYRDHLGASMKGNKRLMERVADITA